MVSFRFFFASFLEFFLVHNASFLVANWCFSGCFLVVFAFFGSARSRSLQEDAVFCINGCGKGLFSALF